MKAGTLMDAFPSSYEGDPLAAVREEPPKNGNGEDQEEEEGSEDLDEDSGADVDNEFGVDQEAESAKSA